LRWIKPPGIGRSHNENHTDKEPFMQTLTEQYSAAMAPRFGQLLAAREEELRTLLEGTGSAPQTSTVEREVTDFKDLAGDETRVAVEEAKSTHLLQELTQLAAARRRLQDHSYGRCIDCGDPIDLRRLVALPATPYCAACQNVQEHAAALAGRH
jgi:DnaK suppressor protein